MTKINEQQKNEIIDIFNTLLCVFLVFLTTSILVILIIVILKNSVAYLCLCIGLIVIDFYLVKLTKYLDKLTGYWM